MRIFERARLERWVDSIVSLSLVKEVINKANTKPEVVSKLKSLSGSVFQLRLEGERPFYIEVRTDGTLALFEGEHESPTAVVSARDEVMAAIIQGRMSGYHAFFRGLLKIHGNVAAVQKFADIMRSAKE